MSCELDGYLEQDRATTAVPHELARVVVDRRMSLRSWGVQTLIWSQRPGRGFSVGELREVYGISRRAWDEYVAEAEALGWTRRLPRSGAGGQFAGRRRWFAHPSKLGYPAEVTETGSSDRSARNGHMEVPETGSSSLDKSGRAAPPHSRRSGAARPRGVGEVLEPEPVAMAESSRWSQPAPPPEAKARVRALARSAGYLVGACDRDGPRIASDEGSEAADREAFEAERAAAVARYSAALGVG